MEMRRPALQEKELRLRLQQLLQPAVPVAIRSRRNPDSPVKAIPGLVEVPVLHRGVDRPGDPAEEAEQIVPPG